MTNEYTMGLSDVYPEIEHLNMPYKAEFMVDFGDRKDRLLWAGTIPYTEHPGSDKWVLLRTIKSDTRWGRMGTLTTRFCRFL